jgi:hypothetical protein
MKPGRYIQVRFVQSRACPAILAAFRDGVGLKLTWSGEPQFGPVPEDPPGTPFRANDQCWEDIPPEREAEAMAALGALIGADNLGPSYSVN